MNVVNRTWSVKQQQLILPFCRALTISWWRPLLSLLGSPNEGGTGVSWIPNSNLELQNLNEDYLRIRFMTTLVILARDAVRLAIVARYGGFRELGMFGVENENWVSGAPACPVMMLLSNGVMQPTMSLKHIFGLHLVSMTSFLQHA